MNLKSGIFNVLVGIVVAVLLYGCGDIPPKIEFTVPDGQVVDASATPVTITGKVTKGTNNILWLREGKTIADALNNPNIPINPDGTFSTVCDLSFGASSSGNVDNSIHCTLNFFVKDSKLVIHNEERITFIKGVAAQPIQGSSTASGVVDNGVNVLLSQDFINNVRENVIAGVNENLPEILATATAEIFPVTLLDVGFANGKITGASLDGISLGEIEFGENEWITAHDVQIDNITINAAANIWIPTIFPPDFGFWFSMPISASATNIALSEARMEAWLNPSTNDIWARIDTDSLDETFWNQLTIDYDLPPGIDFAEPFLKSVSNFAKNLIGVFFTWLFNTVDIPIVDASILSMTAHTGAMTLYGIPIPDMALTGSVWFPTGQLYTTDPGIMRLPKIGVAMEAAEVSVLNPGLDHFLSTPDTDILPTLEFSPALGETLVVGISDDTVNMGAWALMQTDLVNGLDVTAQFQYLAGKALTSTLFKQTVVKAYLKTPPVGDFSGPLTPCTPNGDVIECNAGVFKVRNMVITVQNLMSPGDQARVSADVDAALNLKVSDDGTHVNASMDWSRSEIVVGYLYYNNADLTALGQLSNGVIKLVVNIVMGLLVDLDIESIDLYDLNIQPELRGVEVGDGNMIVRLNVSEAP